MSEEEKIEEELVAAMSTGEQAQCEAKKEVKKKLIEKLTPEQEAAIDPFLARTLKEGLCTDPCDRPLVEHWAKEVYKERGLVPPKDENIHWAESPRAAAFLFAEITGEKPQIPQMHGQHELGWLGFNAFLVEELGLEWEGDIKPHVEMARSSGWWMPFPKLLILCERHNVLKRDVEHRLHSENGASVGYPDGWELFFWHGTAVPKEWILDKENVDPSLALNHENAEERRCLAEILGWETVLQQLNPVTIDKDVDPEIGELIEVKHPSLGDTAERFIRVKCGTGRDFVLPVPPEMKTAAEANAWTYGIDVKDFFVEIRT